MVCRGVELEYDNFELLRGKNHMIRVTHRSKAAGNITISSQYGVLKVTFKVIWVSKSALGASPAVYSNRIPRANQDEQTSPAFDTSTATKTRMWAAPRKTCTY